MIINLVGKLNAFIFVLSKRSNKAALKKIKIMTTPTTFKKPSYLIRTKEELIAERNYMESNWNASMAMRMREICHISCTKFNTPLSAL